MLLATTELALAGATCVSVHLPLLGPVHSWWWGSSIWVSPQIGNCFQSLPTPSMKARLRALFTSSLSNAHQATAVVVCTVSSRNCCCCVQCLTLQPPLLCALSHHATATVVCTVSPRNRLCCVHCLTTQPPLLCALSHPATAFVVRTVSPRNRHCCVHCLTLQPPLLCALSHHATDIVVCTVSPRNSAHNKGRPVRQCTQQRQLRDEISHTTTAVAW